MIEIVKILEHLNVFAKSMSVYVCVSEHALLANCCAHFRIGVVWYLVSVTVSISKGLLLI